MSEEIQIDLEERKPRPGFLTVLCVLTFVSTGFSLITGLFQLIGGAPTEEDILAQKVVMADSLSEMKKLGADWVVEQMEKAQLMNEDLYNHFYLAMGLGTIIIALGLYSAIQMFVGKRIGFKLYIGYCLLTVIELYIFSSPAHIPSFAVIFSLLFSGLFVFLYSRNLWWMK